MTTTFRHTLLLPLLLVAPVLPATLMAQSIQSPAAIDSAVAASLAGTGLSAWPVDRRLKLTSCPDALRVDAPVQGLVAVHCETLRWRIHARIDGPPATFSITPVVIKRGDPVQVEMIATGFTISYGGLAESDARVGDRVQVRVDQKKTPLVAEAVGVGVVRINGLN